MTRYLAAIILVVAGILTLGAQTPKKAYVLVQVDVTNAQQYGEYMKLSPGIIEKFGGGPVGLGTVAVAVGEDAGTLQDVYEPYLIQQGFLERTPRGRCATALAYQRFGLTPPAGQRTLLDE